MSILGLLNTNNYQIYNRLVARELDSIKAAIFLSELINRFEYHQERGELMERDGKLWFYYTVETAEDRLWMSGKKQLAASKILESKGLVERKQMGIPSKRYFSIDEQAIVAFWSGLKNPVRNAQMDQQEIPDGNNKGRQNGATRCDKRDQLYKNSSKSQKEEEPRASIALREATLFYERILENDPKFRKPNLTKWADELDKMHRIDGRSWEEIASLIKFSQEHEFWKGNILSPVKLRKQATQLTVQMNKAPSKQKVEAEKHTENMVEANRRWSTMSHKAILMGRKAVKVFDNEGNGHLISYSEHGFIEQVESALRKWGHK